MRENRSMALSHDTHAPVGVLPRAAVLLRLLSEADEPGLRLQDLVPLSGLARPTVHRLLADLTDLGVVERTASRHYRLGRALEELALALPTPGPLRHLDETRALLQELATDIGDTVYLAQRNYRSATYLMRCDGDSPIRVFSVHVGEVKPLATSYAGIALLAGLDEPVRERAIAETVAALPPRWLPQDPDALTTRLRALVTQVHERGWCGGGLPVVPEVAGIACPVPHPSGSSPVLSITISAAEARMPAARVDELAGRLVEVAARVGALGAAAG